MINLIMFIFIIIFIPSFYLVDFYLTRKIYYDLDMVIKALEQIERQIDQTELNPSYNSIKTELKPCEDYIPYQHIQPIEAPSDIMRGTLDVEKGILTIKQPHKTESEGQGMDKILSKPFDWNDNFSELAQEDFSVIQQKLTYGTATSIGLALAKLALLEKQGCKVELQEREGEE